MPEVPFTGHHVWGSIEMCNSSESASSGPVTLMPDMKNIAYHSSSASENSAEIRGEDKMMHHPLPLETRTPEWSKGADQHKEGMCKPCAWFWKPPSCKWGKECEFCHLCGPSDFKQRRAERVAELKAARRQAKEDDQSAVQQTDVEEARRTGASPGIVGQEWSTPASTYSGGSAPWRPTQLSMTKWSL
mmetsp:Transcript_27298/g.62877  ORF Transcript_27298/g.62877 Transcript_27298/m.62877 type:complete len:188 (+) Transcript_27298:78-641(+)